MILVEYACRKCANRQENWARHEVPDTATCTACGGLARRRFGGTLLGAARTTPPETSGPPSGHSHATPGSCVLTPTAARMFDARVRGDRRAVERETACQERAISEGRLDPRKPPVSGQP
ncbi:hypothetical protein GCM10022222_77430 [Amycolatopsis ultiminotia]|uniref:Putative regulatory protein FmdB zinc ribbon domain-containing protein n=1 Tax=Amycolatopsis ultiminotia TaxID=543629 RepID=A0ABP6YG44_9PSEU